MENLKKMAGIKAAGFVGWHGCWTRYWINLLFRRRLAVGLGRRFADYCCNDFSVTSKQAEGLNIAQVD